VTEAVPVQDDVAVKLPLAKIIVCSPDGSKL
jgi:hypothetical protein